MTQLSPSGFYDQPRTADEAVAAGWELLSSCTDQARLTTSSRTFTKCCFLEPVVTLFASPQFRGHRYANPADFSLVLIYDDAGYIAGSQSVVPTQAWNTYAADPACVA